jgi:hypothetical protein
MEGYCARFALVLHVCRQVAGETDSHDVDEVSMRGAVRLANYFLNHASRVYPCLTSSTEEQVQRDARAILDWVSRNRTKIETKTAGKPARAFTWRMVRRDLHVRFEGKDDDLNSALQHLEGRGYLQEVPQDRAGGTGRRPKPAYFVHPETWCQKRRKGQNEAGAETFVTPEARLQTMSLPRAGMGMLGRVTQMAEKTPAGRRSNTKTSGGGSTAKGGAARDHEGAWEGS